MQTPLEKHLKSFIRPLTLAAVLAPTFLLAQIKEPANPPEENPPKKVVVEKKPAAVKSLDDTIVLSPFEVKASDDNNGYSTATTLAGNRLNTDVRDLGTSLSI